jgi:copper chaperone CopZ
MKKSIKKIAAASILTLLISGYQLLALDKSPEGAVSEIKMKTAEMCNVCKAKIEKYLSFKDGIIDSFVCPEKKCISIMFDSTKVKGDDLFNAMKKFGFEVEKYDKDGQIATEKEEAKPEKKG